MLEIIVLALWAFSFSYLAIILGIPKNGLCIVVGFSISFVDGILIVHLFQNKNRNGKSFCLIVYLIHV
ncbi:hypothetical protein DT426_18870 [Bacillus cereus]|nr:hypothetical protein SD98_20150 [Bacillus thuringiensis serovar morrisoni]AZV67627.1 hypothetical protein DT426_18870 [Bacillus cereus]KAA0830570.1 hypothetical protein DN403_02860 [Bacillus sp. AY2-1]OTY44736.1 hypothetical protein BK736_03870 [Bacillus thuringiensis serovar poloniensis]OUB71016.1 hypothetical protein BK765_11455 [Bacillus thuringiensis serovar dakota]PGO46697.1 hypothetical protein CN977_12395 [Bacillus thuringiensis]